MERKPMSKRDRKRARMQKRRDEARESKAAGTAGSDAKKARSAATPTGQRLFTPETCTFDRIGDAGTRAAEFFAWMIHPMTVETFYASYWEKKPLVIRRKNPDYYKGWLSKRDVELMLERDPGLVYGEDLDVTSYKNKTRETHNGEGRATSEEVWRRFHDGCSVRLLHPQTHVDAVWRMLAMLEGHWGSFAGSNAYLTPGGHQGFAPHYDDIEAFLLQTEGKKHWKVYAPPTEGEVLPRESSGNYSQDDLAEPLEDFVLEAGDLLYFPRGFIHQAVTPDDVPHSLHLTVSSAQKNTWIDIMERALPMGMDIVRDANMVLRRSLPADYLAFCGTQHAEEKGTRKQQFQDLFQSLMTKVVEAIPLDQTADEMALKLLSESLPPVASDAVLRRRHRALNHDLQPVDDGEAAAPPFEAAELAAAATAKKAAGADAESDSDSDSEEDDDVGLGDRDDADTRLREPVAACAIEAQDVWRRRRRRIEGREPLTVRDSVRVLRPGAVRVVQNPEPEGEDDAAVVYHLTRNARVPLGRDIAGVAMSAGEASVVEALVRAYPMYVCVRNLPLPEADEEAKVAFANRIFKHGLVFAEGTEPPRLDA